MPPKKILVTGANGQLGSEIKTLAPQYRNYEFIFHDVDTLDICDYDAIEKVLSPESFEAIINCAAYTAVDKAESESESESETAYKINVDAVKNLAALSKKYGIHLIHISTDYVFDGKNYRPYTESDTTNPQSVYGISKLNGEKAIFEHAENATIIRTAWLYSSFGLNFVKTIQRYALERGVLQVVYDQIGTPTYAADLAKAILEVLPDLPKGIEIFHYSNEGVCSWYDFAQAIVELSGIPCQIIPVETKDYPTPAQRPAYSVFNKSKFKSTFYTEIPFWRDSLKKCLAVINLATIK